MPETVEESTSRITPFSALRAGTPRVLVATTAMLTFISFWRAAAVVLNDMGSSAFYAGAMLESPDVVEIR